MDTARERAEHIGRLLREFNLGEGRMDAIEREILAAEREAVEAFAAYLAPKIDMPNAVRMHLEAWLRSRGEG